MNLTFFAYVLSGALMYGVYRLLKNHILLSIGLMITGASSYLLLDLLRLAGRDPLMVTWPGWFSAVMGGLCGSILWGVLKLNLFRYQGFRVISTLAMGLSQALLCFLLRGLLIQLRLMDTSLNPAYSFLTFLLIGFLCMFGFTFFQRRERI